MILNSFVEIYVSSREVSFQKQKEGRKEEKSLPSLLDQNLVRIIEQSNNLCTNMK